MTDIYSEFNDEGALSEEDDLFYFESDHLALQGNVDYSELLKTIVILEAQRVQGIQNYETVLRLQKEALENPMHIVEKLQRGEDLGVPGFQNVAEIPKINFSKYKVPVPKKCLELLDKTVEEEVIDLDKSVNKNHTGKQTWSAEEQKRLEELLVTYPPEAVEMNRFKKIAKALGNRTVQQVTSRVQKYFHKLYKFGLPIPGRVPKWRYSSKRGGKGQRYCKFYEKPSTFFPYNIVPVQMTDAYDVPGPSNPNLEKIDFPTISDTSNSAVTLNSFSSNCDLDDDTRNKLKIKLLEEIKSVKQEESMNTELLEYRHLGYMCDYCNEDPIVGSRWHCETCQHDSFDFCTDCLISQLYSEPQNHLSHKFTIIGSNTERQSTHTVELDANSSKANSNIGDGNVMDEGSDSNGSGSDESDDDEEEDGNYMMEGQEDSFELSNTGEEDSDIPSSGNVYDEDYFMDSMQRNYLDPNYQLND